MSATVEPRSLALERSAVATQSAARRRRRTLHVALQAGFILLSLVYLVPFAWLLSPSLKLDGREIAMPPEWIPDPIVWSNYYRALTSLPMILYLRNTLI